MTREEIIERLRALGIDDRPRDWSMGETVEVFLGIWTEGTGGGPGGWPGGIYLYPDREMTGRWCLYDLQRVERDPHAIWGDIESLVRDVAKIHSEWADRRVGGRRGQR
jgi:hypothetical protein